MRSYTISRILFALITLVSVSTPAFAHPHGYRGHHYRRPYYGNAYGYGYPATYPVYNNYGYRGYAPYGEYGNRTARNVAIGSGIGAAVGMLASQHGHRYY